eukprot:gene28663-20719_t
MSWLFVTTLAVATPPSSWGTYILGEIGSTCTSTCMTVGKSCVPHIQTNNTLALFADLGVKCKLPSKQNGEDWAADQPSYVALESDPNYGECLGYKDVPNPTQCDASYSSVRRICNCGAAKDICWQIPGGEKPCWDDTAPT